MAVLALGGDARLRDYFLLMTVGVETRTNTAGIILQGSVVFLAFLALWFGYKAMRSRREAHTDVAAAEARYSILHDRLTIARELHDLLSHGLGAITLSARAADITDSPEIQQQALRDIAKLSEEATNGLRKILTVLREGGTAAPLQPAATIADIAQLIADYREAGLQIDSSGLDLRVNEATELLVYQVVREALTNVTQHAGPTHVQCHITSSDGMIRVCVRDDGPRSRWESPPSSGAGLALLAELVASMGGKLSHGPLSPGYYVQAAIPSGDPHD